MSDTQATLGKLIEAGQPRDAIHIAVAPVIANVRLTPGQHIGFVTSDTETVGGHASKPIGIVDPFLKMAVQPGERFWMFLYPNTITSLRHQWTHPVFGSEAFRAYPASEQWIREWAERYGVTYSDMIEAAKDYIKTGEYFSRGGTFEGERVPEEFWTHFERVTGQVVPDDDRRSFFSCSC